MGYKWVARWKTKTINMFKFQSKKIFMCTVLVREDFFVEDNLEQWVEFGISITLASDIHKCRC